MFISKALHDFMIFLSGSMCLKQDFAIEHHQGFDLEVQTQRRQRRQNGSHEMMLTSSSLPVAKKGDTVDED